MDCAPLLLRISDYVLLGSYFFAIQNTKVIVTVSLNNAWMGYS